MVLYTDDIRFASCLFPDDMSWEDIRTGCPAPAIRPFVEALVRTAPVYRTDVASAHLWKHIILVNRAVDSQFDVLNDIARSTTHCSEELLSVAGSGEHFHGFKDRPWVAIPGNLHLSAHVCPRGQIDHPAVAFTVLAAVSALQAIDDVGALQQPPSIKWVNDIVIGSAKVGGVLASVHVQDAAVTCATLGIGLNVEKTPLVPPTPFVPHVGCVREFSRDPSGCSLPAVFQKLIAHLGANYRLLLAGGFPQLLSLYRSRSLVLGRPVRIHDDRRHTVSDQLLSGVVSSIGDDLQLFLEGVPSPVCTGRLELLTL